MKVLVVGGGGREHALVWKIAQSKRVKKIFCAPGNAGIADLAECVPIGAADIDQLLAFAQKEKIDLTVVGPEDPLSQGIVDRFEVAGLRIFGASQKAARVESSKSFAKAIMEKYGIPTAKGQTFTRLAPAQAYVKQMGAPLVVKADGLAAGKGVIVCSTEKMAMDALKQIMVDRDFGEAGNQVVVEECLVGEEASFLAFTDGKTVLPLPSSQDHKPVFDDDKGLNTGGMGAYSPAPVVDQYLHQRIMNEIMIPMVKGMVAEGCPYKGVLYAGLMIDRDKIKVLEFNGRFGDPEAQPLLVRLQDDIVPIMEAVIDERLDTCRLTIDPRASVCVVMASGGYPGKYKKGLEIKGIDAANRMRDVVVFHAGTSAEGKKVLSQGGRVLGVTALGPTVEDAIKKAYQAVAKIDWQGVHYRSDIGKKALVRMQTVPRVGIVMGSDSDLKVMEAALGVFKKFSIPIEMTVASAHRSPERAAAYAATAKERGLKAIIAGAGHAAHLAGVLAAHTTLPVIGVPIDSSCLQGMDALLATVQMPPGIPVATVSIGKPGAKNAAILAVQMMALSDESLADQLAAFKQEMAAEVEKKAEKLALYR
ncbi:phosphoribosylamine--glycine ligase [uncultured Desulfosarcina sp.]|uniref:phosphoribosylamine--glycine ligase n=1 Tax=uncultured Desulfosarcina sp. TaxID=218289 RepID=UPI0029C673E4|nr:phosphoribosylamine--glycine ligase [uncultured Desulfosarcina sp.]